MIRYFLAFGLSLVWFSAGEANERRVGLVIGNSEYAHAGRLTNPANDAADVAAALQRLGFEVTLKMNLDGSSIDRTADAFLNDARGASVAVFYYAGHGLQHDGGAYLVPVDARLDNEFSVKRETFSAQEFVSALESAARVGVVALDACRNNPLAENLRRSLQSRQRSASVGRGLGRIDVGAGNMLVVYSAAPGQEAADGDGRNSPFASALLKHMETPGLEVEQMLKRVTADVDALTDHRQQPERLSRLKLELWLKPGAGASEAEQRKAELDRREAELLRREQELKGHRAGTQGAGTQTQAQPQVQAATQQIQAQPQVQAQPQLPPAAQGQATRPAQAPGATGSKPALRVAALDPSAAPAQARLIVNGGEAAGWALKKKIWLDGALAQTAVNAGRSVFVAGGQRDGRIHVLDARSMTERSVFPLPQYKQYTLDGVAVFGEETVAVTRQGALEMYGAANGALLGRIDGRPGYDRGHLYVSRDGLLLYFVQTSIQAQKSILNVLERRADGFHPVEETPFDARIDSLDSNMDDSLLTVGLYPTNEVRLYDRAARKTVWSRTCSCSVKFVAGDKAVAFAGRPGADAGNYGKGSKIGLFDAANPDRMRVHDPKTTETLEISDASPDGGLFLVTSTNTGLVTVMSTGREAAQLTPVKTLADNSRQSVNGAFFVRGPSAIVTASGDNNVRFWGAKDGVVTQQPAGGKGPAAN